MAVHMLARRSWTGITVVNLPQPWYYSSVAMWCHAGIDVACDLPEIPAEVVLTYMHHPAAWLP
jgi:hypothetical protein